jgi:hypothetical protein
VAFTDLLIHTVEVYARATVVAGGTAKLDRFGQPLSVNPRQHDVGGLDLVATYPCRTYMKAGGLVMMERAIDTFERVYEMFTDVDALIYEDDAVRILDADGVVLVNLAKIKDSETKFDSTGAHHKEFMVWVQSGPNPVRVPE